MRSDSIAFAIAGIAFGLIAGWVIGTQQASVRQPIASSAQAAAPPAPGGQSASPRAAALDQSQVTALTSAAEREPANAKPRVDLGNLYFDAERYAESIRWYTEALKIAPGDVNVSTDLGVCYYYINQPDKALEQFAHSLKISPKHTKTLLNLGIVKAFGKQDLEGATAAWQQVLQIAPDSPEGQAARRAIDTLRSAHPATTGAAQPPGT